MKSDISNVSHSVIPSGQLSLINVAQISKESKNPKSTIFSASAKSFTGIPLIVTSTSTPSGISTTSVVAPFIASQKKSREQLSCALTVANESSQANAKMYKFFIKGLGFLMIPIEDEIDYKYVA